MTKDSIKDTKAQDVADYFEKVYNEIVRDEKKASEENNSENEYLHEINFWKDGYFNLKKELIENSQENRGNMDIIEKLKEQLEEEKTKSTSYYFDKVKYQVESKALKEELSIKEQRLERLENDLDDLVSQYDDLSDDYYNYKSEEDSYLQEVVQSYQNYKKSKDKTEELNQETIEDLYDIIESKEEMIHDLLDTVKGTEKELDMTNKALEEAYEELSELKCKDSNFLSTELFDCKYITGETSVEGSNIIFKVEDTRDEEEYYEDEELETLVEDLTEALEALSEALSVQDINVLDFFNDLLKYSSEDIEEEVNKEPEAFSGFSDKSKEGLTEKPYYFK